ncbi:VOC family protein [Chitinophaga sp. SYP-B3965]|uniref:VOC family protein n=1 Tax=Chitinophaga sp. SYP-B3965 TaxID=2663120 RepID=UPI0012996C68|nr:VOC family protein [Chitinophaga sp. SYP-B3965]MRG47610.1 VOC family protein [Chitinophaga sp. SYP-B3965]
MQISKNALNWFEIPVSNFDRARDFYSHILHVDITEMNIGADRLGLFPYDAENGGIGGAIVQGPDFIPSQRGCLIYLHGGNDLTEVLARVPDAGGCIEKEKHAVSEDQPDLGYIAIFRDSEGNRIGLHSPA